MSAKWMRVETDFVDHPKTFRLAALLNEPLAEAYILRAWTFLSRFCPTGHVRDTDGTALEAACRWRGQPGALLEALVKTEWLEVSPGGGWEAHDWGEHQGKVAQRAAKERERKRAYRERKAAEASASVPPVSRGTSAGRPAQRDVTGRDVTGRDVEKSAALFETPPAPTKPRRMQLPDKPPDPRHAPLVAELVTAYEAARGAKYPFTGRDARAVSEMLATAQPGAITAAFGRALRHDGYPRVSSLPELARNLAHFLADAPSSGRGPIPAESVDWSGAVSGEVPL